MLRSTIGLLAGAPAGEGGEEQTAFESDKGAISLRVYNMLDLKHIFAACSLSFAHVANLATQDLLDDLQVNLGISLRLEELTID
jgi:hypothetical protein